MPGKKFIAIKCNCKACPECEKGFDSYMDLTFHDHVMCRHEAAFMRKMLRKPPGSAMLAK